MALRSKEPKSVPPTYPKYRGNQPVNGPERPSNPPQGGGMPKVTHTPPMPEVKPPAPSLINPERRAQISQPQPATQSLDTLDVGQLIELREKIEQRLPALMLADLNLEKELVIQFLAIKSMLAKIVDDEDTPANQRAQVANSVTSILGDMTKMQNAVYNSERVKKLEAAMIKALEALPLDARQVFIERYEDIYHRL